MSASAVTSKVTTQHRARTPSLYAPQSTLRRVIHNGESAERQYALRQRAVAFRWPAERIVVTDTDQASVGASTGHREDCPHLVAEVGIGRPGIMLGLEVSRLARNNADWHWLRADRHLAHLRVDLSSRPG